MQRFYLKPLLFTLYYDKITNVLADVAEWQTHQTQNLTAVMLCGFKSRHPHWVKVVKVSCILGFTTFLFLMDWELWEHF